MPDLPSLSILHRHDTFLTPDKLIGLHNSPITIKRLPAVACNTSSVCGACATTGTGKVIEFYDQDTYQFQFFAPLVSGTNYTSYYGTGAIKVYYWDRPPNRSTSTPPVMLGFNFYQYVNSGDTFTFTSKGNMRWLTFMQKNLYKYTPTYTDYYFDALCVKLDNFAKTITAVSF